MSENLLSCFGYIQLRSYTYRVHSFKAKDYFESLVKTSEY